jgi:hypothetical protein
VSGPPASWGMMWSASVAGALWQMTQVIGPLLNSSFRALLNSGVERRVMLFRFFSSALGCACGCLHVTGWVGAVIAPHSSTYEVWLPDDYTKGRTPLTFVTFGRCTGRSMTACSTHAFRVCLPAEYNSLRGRASVCCLELLTESNRKHRFR